MKPTPADDLSGQAVERLSGNCSKESCLFCALAEAGALRINRQYRFARSKR